MKRGFKSLKKDIRSSRSRRAKLSSAGTLPPVKDPVKVLFNKKYPKMKVPDIKHKNKKRNDCFLFLVKRKYKNNKPRDNK